MDPDVQNTPGEPPAGDGDELRGLRALFRKRTEDDQPAARPAMPRTAATARPANEGTASPGLVKSAGGTATRPAAGTTTGSRPRPAGSPNSGATKVTKTSAGAAGTAPARNHRPHNPASPITSRPLVNPHLRQDPRLRYWIIRVVVAVIFYLGFMFWLGWRVALTAAVIYIAADALYRSRTASIVPTSVRVTSAQRYTRRRLKVLQAAGYLALHARRIPGTKHVVDHLVVGPAGVFSLDSVRMDKRLQVKMIGGMLFYGKESYEPRLDHAQHEADHAARLIGAELGHKIKVRPVMVLYGPAIDWVVLRLKGVDVFEGSRVGAFFRKQSKDTKNHHLDSSQISMIFAAAARALPPLT